MGTWARTGPVVVEVDGTAEGLHVVDYAAHEAIRTGARLVLAASVDTSVDAIAHVRQRFGYRLAVRVVSERGSRLKVLAQAARQARLLVVGRSRTRGPQRLVAAQTNLFLAARAGCPVVVVPLTWRPSADDRKVRRRHRRHRRCRWKRSSSPSAPRRTAEADLIVVHAQRAPRHDTDRDGVENSWVQRADLTVAETHGRLDRRVSRTFG